MCFSCQTPFSRKDFDRESSPGTGTFKKSAGLEGVRLLYYVCPIAIAMNIFIEMHPLRGETATEFHERKELIQSALK
jgi:hypothetical protein